MLKMISLSKYLGIERKQLEDCHILDIDLGVDTRFFIDPLLLRNTNILEFKNSREKILAYFTKLIKMIKVSSYSSQMRKKIIDMLAVKEPQGLSIGYGGKTDRGTAISKKVAQEMVKTIIEILQIGIEDPEIVEVLSMFVSGYGPDSISDLTVNIIYEDFCNFTQRNCKALGVETKEFNLNGKKYFLPKHPFENNPILFIPISLISPLPVATDWDGVSEAARFNEDLRSKVNQIIFPTLMDDIDSIRSKDEAKIEQIKERLNNLIDVYKNIEVSPYNLTSDPLGFYSISPAVEKLSKNIKALSDPKNNADLILSVRGLLSQFKTLIECNGLNKILFDLDGKVHKEEVFQLLFYAVANVYCNFTNILLSRESNSGRGPVDFSLGTGYKNKIIVELKKSNNSQLISGYTKQVEAYKKGESAFYAFYLVFVVSSRKKNDKLSVIEKMYEEEMAEENNLPELFIIDGVKYNSPSKLK